MNIMTKCLAPARAGHAWFYRLLFFLLALLFINTVSAEAGVTFSWFGNPPQENVTGYRLYFGAQSRFDTSGKLKAGFAYDYYLDFATFKRCVPGGTTPSCVNLTSSDYSCTNLSGSAPQCTINNLQGLLYFALTAYNATSESGYTSELSKTVEVGAQPPPDTTAPVITSGPTVDSITGTSANIRWSTNEQASTVLRYGLTSSNLSRAVSISSYQTAHQQTLSSLQPGTRYYFRIESTDPSGNKGYGTVAKFTTKAAARTAALLATDSDGDGIIAVNDNSPAAFNPDQTDKNGNGQGNVLGKFNWNLFLPIIMRNEPLAK